MKVWQIILIIGILYLIPIVENNSDKTKKEISTEEEFQSITNFLETNSGSKQSYESYVTRLQKLRRKKEIIIKSIYEVIPIVGEILALSNVEKINLIVNQFFIFKETELMRKYIIMWDANSNYVRHSAKVLLNLILCNNKFNRLRCILNLLLEGLCVGDKRSLLIFKEIVVTVILDTLLKTKFYYFNDLQAKFNLIRVFNKKFEFKPITKIQFVEKMMISDKLKDILTFIIMRLKTNLDVEVEMDQRLHEIPPLLANNTKLFEFNPKSINTVDNISPEEKQNILEEEIEKSITKDNTSKSNTNEQNKKTLSRVEAREILENLKTSTITGYDSFKFKEKLLFENENLDKTYLYEETKIIDPNHLDLNTKQKLKLSEVKEGFKDDYMTILYNQTYTSMPELQEIEPNYQIGIFGRTIYPKYRKHIMGLILLNILLDNLPPNTPKGSINVSNPVVTKRLIKTTITKEVAPGITLSMQFKEKGKRNQPKDEFRFKSRSESEFGMRLTTKDENFADHSFELLTNQRYLPKNNYNKNDNEENDSNLNTGDNIQGNNYNDNNMTDHHSNNYNDDKSNKYNDDQGNNFNDDQVKQQIIDNAQNSEDVQKIMKDDNVKVLFPKEIHTTYQVNKKGKKTIETNKNNPTKKLILDKLMSEKEFNDLMIQQEKGMIIDPLGLYTVLKNIQDRKCSCGFLCIEIGTIYGDFDKLRPRNITVSVNENKNIHLIIKPIVIVNGTQGNGPSKNETNLVNLFENDDCDELKLSGFVKKSSSDTNFNFKSKLPRFKQYPKGIVVRRQNIQRKFYRKVAIGEEIYALDTFKQGLNVIIVQRNRGYEKLYEKTFDTNNSRKESDQMAEILRDTPCSKIIIITGIGKWMGAMTPLLIKEIKQIGGPDLNNLYSPDQDDNSMADHAFILIGRRGLCRYNGVFRVKNYDLSKAMSRFFPDLSSDPNDCYFEDISLENSKNRNSEKEFYHLIDLRLTLNLNNDNRFAWDAPTVSNVSPFRGSIHGGQEIKIGGFNLGIATTDLREILVRGVICGDFILLSPNLLSCITRGSTILGPGPGNVVIKMLNGYESPKRTCSVYEYVGDPIEPLNDLKQTITTVQKMQNLPIYMNSNYHDQDISLFDHLMFNQAHYKKKLLPDHSNAVAVKLDNMVKNNYHNLIGVVNTPKGLLPPPEGLRKRRFKNIINNLEPCSDK